MDMPSRLKASIVAWIFAASSERQLKGRFKLILWFWLAAPLVDLSIRAAVDALGANPQEALLRGLGQQTLVLVLLVLASPLVSAFLGRPMGQAWMACRRMVGLWCFAYASIHLLAYWQFEHDLMWRPLWADLWTRPFVTVGVLAWLCLVPLAITSNRWSMQHLQRQWKRLHQLVWPIMILGLAHFYLHKAGKNDYAEPLLFSLMLIFLVVGRRRLRSSQRVQIARREGHARPESDPAGSHAHE
ncbi:COG2717 Predicted membrane protein [Burkholderiales bacterium]